MERGRGAVEADIGGEPRALRQGVEGVGLRNLVDEAAARQHIEKIGLEGRHPCGSLAPAMRDVLISGRVVYQVRCRIQLEAAMLQAIGLMSGTSLDGVDIAAVSTDGERITALGPRGYRPYAEAERDLLRRALAEATALDDRAARPGALAAAEGLVTLAHGEAVARFLAEHG